MLMAPALSLQAAPLLNCNPVVAVARSANPRDVDYCYQCDANADDVKQRLSP